VKVYLQPAGAISVAEKTGGSASVRVGRDYLRYRRDERDRRKHA